MKWMKLMKFLIVFFHDVGKKKCFLTLLAYC